MLRNCQHCSTTFNVTPYRASTGRGKFCSKKCYDTTQTDIEWAKRRKGNYMECRLCGKIIYARPSVVGRKKFCSRYCAMKLLNSLPKAESTKLKWRIAALKSGCRPPSSKGKKFSESHRRNLSSALCKFNSENGNDGSLPKMSIELRKGIDYKLWREAVFRRDNYTCVICGYDGREIQADHIKSFGKYPNLRYEISNGRTLCLPCHRKTPTWGRKLKLSTQ